MTALTNRGLALKLAVEHATSSGGYDFLQDDDLSSVFSLADKFASWIGGQNATTESAEQPAEREPAQPQRTASDAVDAILAGVQAQADRLGGDLVETVQREAGRLRTYRSFSAATEAAQAIIQQNAATIGATSADRLRRIVRDAR